MGKGVIISSDSTCDLSPELIKRYDVKILPLVVNFGDESRRDGVDAFPDDVYEYYRQTGKLTTTAAGNINDYMELFTPYVKDGYEIVHFNISKVISGSHQNAMLAAADLTNVYPIDSMNLSTGIGLLVLIACEMAAAGYTGAQIADRINALREKVDASFIVDTLLYLWKGGRCSSVAALGANMLQLKPCIEVKNGTMDVCKKYRGKLDRALTDYVDMRLSDIENIYTDRIFITHSGIDPAIIDQVRTRILHNVPFDEILVTRAGCTISNHCGPNTLGILFMRK